MKSSKFSAKRAVPFKLATHCSSLNRLLRPEFGETVFFRNLSSATSQQSSHRTRGFERRKGVFWKANKGLVYLIFRYGILAPDLILSGRRVTKTKEQFCFQTHYCSVGPCTFARILSLINQRLKNFIANIPTINPIFLTAFTTLKSFLLSPK